MKAACPSCGQHVSYSGSLEGTTVECPNCSKPMRLPAAVPAEAVDEPVADARQDDPPASPSLLTGLMANRWALMVCAIYMVLLVILLALAFAVAVDMDAAILGWPPFWVFVAVLGLAQYVLLRVPVSLVMRRPVVRRPVWMTVAATAFAMAVLATGFLVALCEYAKVDGGGYLITACLIGLASWVAWAVYFHRATRVRGPDNNMQHLRKCLWRGSALELLVAVPMHIAVRHRDECCAGFLTFIGLACGLSVMLFAFGPSVFFIYAARWRQLHPGESGAN